MAKKKVNPEEYPVEEVVSWQRYNELRSAQGGKGSYGGQSLQPSQEMLIKDIDKVTGEVLGEGQTIPKMVGETRYDVVYDSSYVAEYFVNLLTSLKFISVDPETDNVSFTKLFDRFFNTDHGEIAQYAKQVGTRKAKEKELKDAQFLMARFPGLNMEAAVQMVRQMSNFGSPEQSEQEQKQVDNGQAKTSTKAKVAAK